MKIYWHLLHCFEVTDDHYIMVCNNRDNKEFMCSNDEDAAWLVGVLNKLENGDE